jgi:DNA helicase-2/ATP-dependent DNA helicase PcrA
MNILDNLNPPQKEAVMHGQGPLLILAGAGSGKTRVLTHRVAYLIAVRKVPPSRILAVTFTNKAAGEMRTRVIKMLGRAAADLWLGTFHSICVRILRRQGQKLGYAPNFVIYDQDDQMSVVRKAMAELEVPEKRFPPRGIHARISDAKNRLVSPEDFGSMVGDFFEEQVAKVYPIYQRKLEECNALDFDDLLWKTTVLFEKFPEIKEDYGDRFLHVLVDEYQDTNHAQYVLVKQMAEKHRNLCVVGDDDQSIYGWRGADIHNILDFEKDFPEAKVVKLEENYRSTKKILDAAGAVVKNNLGRKEKTLWTQNEEGTNLVLMEPFDEREEGRAVVQKIQELKREGYELKDFVTLYRTNAQSRALEEGFRNAGIPYVIVGGLKFYERKEIKDVLAYLKVLLNPKDEVSLTRIVNVPLRGIGETSLKRLLEYAGEKSIPFYEALVKAGEIEDRIPPKAKDGFRALYYLLERYRKRVEQENADALTGDLVQDIGYVEELKRERTVDAESRIENIQELLAGVEEFCERSEDKSLAGFLGEVSLLTDIDTWDEEKNAVTLMTLHNAKGLEFPVVFICGLEEGLFPHASSLDDPAEMEEERRLFYVGLTRAKERAFLSTTSHRRRYGRGIGTVPSRFLEEVPKELVTIEGRSAAGEDGFYDRVEDENDGLRPGTRVRHPAFGVGQVLALEGGGDGLKAVVLFRGGRKKTLVVRYANLMSED